MVDLYKRQDQTVANNAGGQVFAITPLQQLERFLILGSADGTFYVGARELTAQNFRNLENLIRDQPLEALELIRDIGVSNRAYKHDPVLAAYAVAIGLTAGNAALRGFAFSFFNDIIRTGTHLFRFMEYADGRVGWGRSFQRAVANWYLNRSDMSLANQLVKYKAREGWSHRDVLRLSHARPNTSTRNGLFRYAVNGTLEADDSKAHALVAAAIEASQTTDVGRAVELITTYNLPREVLNSSVMNKPEVWEALVPHMGLTALLRNLRNMTKDGYLTQGSDAVRVVRDRLINAEDIRASRIHPAQVFSAQKNSQSANRRGEFVVIPAPIIDTLEETFYASFANVEPTNKRIMLALDVSGSMTSLVGDRLASAMEWSALQAMVTARSEPYAEFMAFSHKFVPLQISRRDSLQTIVNRMRSLDFGATDCSLPMQHATANNLKFDAFAVYTDNETWYRQSKLDSMWGRYANNPYDALSPVEALREYRRKSGIHDAKLAVVAIAATQFSIADPNDVNMLDFVGFDASAPAVMADFIRG